MNSGGIVIGMLFLLLAGSMGELLLTDGITPNATYSYWNLSGNNLFPNDINWFVNVSNLTIRDLPANCGKVNITNSLLTCGNDISGTGIGATNLDNIVFRNQSNSIIGNELFWVIPSVNNWYSLGTTGSGFADIYVENMCDQGSCMTIIQAIADSLTLAGHLVNTNNPHSVTSQQVGSYSYLENNMTNVLQNTTFNLLNNNLTVSQLQTGISQWIRNQSSAFDNYNQTKYCVEQNISNVRWLNNQTQASNMSFWNTYHTQWESSGSYNKTYGRLNNVNTWSLNNNFTNITFAYGSNLRIANDQPAFCSFADNDACLWFMNTGIRRYRFTDLTQKEIFNVTLTGEITANGISYDGTGKVVCIKADSSLGTCSSIVAIDGTCTCG